MSQSDQNSSQRHTIIWILVAIVTFFGSMQIYGLLTRPPKYHPKYHTIAHRFMDLEGKYVSIPDESYELLDDVITEAKSSIHYDATITDPAKREEQLLNVFSTIDSILIRRNFIFPPDVTTTLGEALADHQMSSSAMEAAMALPHNARRIDHMKAHTNENFHLIGCVPNAFLYMGVAEVIGFDLKPVLLPLHIFVRTQFDKDHWMNWDPNRGRSISDEDYASGWSVEDWQISQKIYLNTLSPKQTDAEMFTNIGSEMYDHDVFGGLAAEIECYRKALELNPREIYANSNLAQCLMFRPELDSGLRTESLQFAQRAVNLSPQEGSLHLTLAYAWADNGNTAAAVAEVKQAIQLDSENQEARDMLPLIESGYTMYDAFKTRQPIAFWIRYENGWLYISIAVPIVALGAIIWLIRWRINRNISSTSESIPELMAVGQ